MTLKHLRGIFIAIILPCILIACGKQELKKSTGEEDQQKYIQKINNQKRLQAEKEKQAKEEKVRQSIREFLHQGNYNGAVTVVKDHHLIFNEGFGYADLDKKTLNQADTTFPIGSITKIFVSTSVMQLQEQGKLNIQDPVSKYLPEFPNGQNIKLYNFLTHTSGIDRLHWQKGDTTAQKLVQEIERHPAKYPPGTKWDYLDANYMILGYIVEKVTGMNLHDYIQKNIMDKVPMKQTGFITHEHPVPYSSVGYIQDGDKIETTKYLSVYPLFGCGNIYTTAADMSQFDQALMDGKLVSDSSLQQILTPSGLSSYGLGLYKNKEGMAYSIGVLGGWYTIHAYYPDKTSIVVFLNSRSKTFNIETVLGGIRGILQASDKEQTTNKNI